MVIQRVGMMCKNNLNPVAYCCEGDRTVVSGVDETRPPAKQMKCMRLSILVRRTGSDIIGMKADLPASIALYIIRHIEVQVSSL